ncbi:hypothetical protein [Rhodococcus sp. IEGM 1351]|uniref:hypothetical protein n=1 Tax=Rhodococcus sp. IEGM 1351 TaxID=3047089 RepID=UPI0024B77F7C|nr:hypothetical protein [Rhodococcus sp. IEGM 1351]
MRMGEMSVSAAAAELGVSGRQVTRLARAGELVVTREVGKALLLDAGSVHRVAQAGRHRGRPWNGDVAWAALAMLSGVGVDWISRSQVSRLRHRLRRASATEVAFLARRRARVHRMRGWGDDLNTLVTGGYVAATGVSALTHVPGVAGRFGLSGRAGGAVDGYVVGDDLDGVIDTFGLVADGEGDVTLRVVTALDRFFTTTTLPVATVAVDLMESLDTRERSAGARVLGELLDDFR